MLVAPGVAGGLRYRCTEPRWLAGDRPGDCSNAASDCHLLSKARVLYQQQMDSTIIVYCGWADQSKQMYADQLPIKYCKLVMHSLP